MKFSSSNRRTILGIVSYFQKQTPISQNAYRLRFSNSVQNSHISIKVMPRDMIVKSSPRNCVEWSIIRDCLECHSLCLQMNKSVSVKYSPRAAHENQCMGTRNPVRGARGRETCLEYKILSRNWRGRFGTACYNVIGYMFHKQWPLFRIDYYSRYFFPKQRACSQAIHRQWHLMMLEYFKFGYLFYQSLSKMKTNKPYIYRNVQISGLLQIPKQVTSG